MRFLILYLFYWLGAELLLQLEPLLMLVIFIPIMLLPSPPLSPVILPLLPDDDDDSPLLVLLSCANT